MAFDILSDILFASNEHIREGIAKRFVDLMVETEMNGATRQEEYELVISIYENVEANPKFYMDKINKWLIEEEYIDGWELETATEIINLIKEIERRKYCLVS